MIDELKRSELAALLRTALVTRTPIPPIADGVAGLEVDDAYAIQTENINAEIAAGAVIVGHKIGLTSGAMQSMMGVGSPDFGHLLDTMVLDATAPIPLERFIQPRIEVELAFVLGSDLPHEGCTTADVIAATDSVFPCLELIDSRIVDWRIGLLDTVADNASSAGVILGDERIDPGINMDDLAAELWINDQVVATGSTADVIGTPAGAVAWLANAVGAYGVRLRAGHIVLSGSCTRAIDIAPGDEAIARFSGLPELRVRFADDEETE